MKASIRAAFMTGAAALSVGALSVTAMAPPEYTRTIKVERPVDFTADSLPIGPGAPAEPPTDDELNSALALLEQLAPVTDGRAVTVTLRSHEHPGSVTVASAVPNATAKAVGDSDDIAVQGAPGEPVALNAASDVIDGVYSISRYWANYVSLELGPWLINWVPFGYLISDQIYIWYPDFVLPTVDSFVYDFLDPVVNNPLNLEVWIDGIGDMISTAANGLAAGVTNEINYIVTFGWLPWPLPPLPDFPLPGLGSASAAATTSAVALTSIEVGEAAAEATDGSTANPTEGAAAEPVDTDTTEDAAAEDAAAEDATEQDATAEAPVEEGAQENVGDDTVAPTQDQPEDSETSVEAVDGAADERTGESSIEPGGEAQDALDDTADAPDAADESDAADQSADQSADADASEGAQQDTTSGSGGESGDTDSDGLGASGSEH